MAGFYTSDRWQKARRQALHAGNFACARCGESLIGKGQAAHVHHRRELKRAPALALEPLNLLAVCRDCHNAIHQAEKFLPANWVVDIDGNPQSASHHWNGGKRWGYSIPHNLKPSGIPVTLICGPPGAGKTTLARELAGDDDTVIDIDDCKQAIGGDRWDCSPMMVRRALAYRDKMLRTLHQRSKGHAFVIVGAPSRSERKAWCDALVTVESVRVLDTPADVCINRIERDVERRHAAAEQARVVHEWWLTYRYGRKAKKPNEFNN